MLGYVQGRKLKSSLAFHRYVLATPGSLIIALLAASSSDAQQTEILPPVTITEQQPRTLPTRTSPQPKRVAVRPAPRTPATPPPPPPPISVPAPAPAPAPGTTAPRNLPKTLPISLSGGYLRLPPREIPATVEVIDARQIQEQGLHTLPDIANGAVGVTAGDFPGDPSGFSMRGFTDSLIPQMYNGIKIGPASFNSVVMETSNLAAVEIIKGPASLLAGEGAMGGAINYVTKAPHTGPVQNEAFVGFDSFGTIRGGFGSGGSTAIKGLDYRFDVSRSVEQGFVDDVNIKNLHLSTQFDYRVSESFKAFVAAEYKDYSSRAYWGTPIVSAAFAGPNSTSGILSGTHVSFNNGTDLGAVTIDRRTLETNYNVLDNHRTGTEVWVRGGFNWDITNNVRMRSQFYTYDADREWFNSEQYGFNAVTGLVDRDRFFIHIDQKQFGNITDVTFDSNIAGMDNRFVTALEARRIEFVQHRPAPGSVVGDSVTLVNPVRGFFGPLTQRFQTNNIDNVAAVFDDRLKITPTFAVVGGLRLENIDIDRASFSAEGASLAGFPFSHNYGLATGRIGYTWEAYPGMTFYSQYATSADFSTGSIFLLAPGQNPLTRGRTLETGVKDVLWGGRAEWTFAAYDILRKNVLSTTGGETLTVAGEAKSQGIEFAASVRPTPDTRLWGNIAYVHARYTDFVLDDGRSFTGNTPPNVPTVVINGGASYRFSTAGWPVINVALPGEVGVTVRHVGDRFNQDANDVIMRAYTTADVYAFVDIPRLMWFPNVENTRLTFRVRNVTDTKYALWGDPFYPDQILLGAPRRYEMQANFKF